MNRVLFFAGLRERVEKEELEIDVTGRTVGEVKELVSEKYGLDQIQSCMTAVNEEFALNDMKIEEGDTIAFIPPVSGG
ncbi:molybdopterin converting factor subunit 1 [Halobacillus litoralis]|uniref:Molybdopterin synthase sulfur carrier subunit n=1 Tax=Halobacillus litoralis TaxID=45668 RepID=A0A410MA65_9BACI|nr:molybdopterin converting factor subunit 1 [Halobacillus litoralis]QAS51634.1 molybdopterin converting factor subunit 1 [Halobacillus litoralis]